MTCTSYKFDLLPLQLLFFLFFGCIRILHICPCIPADVLDTTASVCPWCRSIANLPKFSRVSSYVWENPHWVLVENRIKLKVLLMGRASIVWPQNPWESCVLLSPASLFDDRCIQQFMRAWSFPWLDCNAVGFAVLSVCAWDTGMHYGSG